MEHELEAVILAGANDEDVEFVLMHHILINRDQNHGLWRQQEFNLNELSDDDIIQNFRFQRDHLRVLKECLGLPNVLITEEGHNVEGM